MIWRTVLNVLWALIRNAFQQGHQCTQLEKDPYPEWGWTWECSCGNWGVNHGTEVEAIKDFHRHTGSKRKPVWV